MSTNPNLQALKGESKDYVTVKHALGILAATAAMTGVAVKVFGGGEKLPPYTDNVTYVAQPGDTLSGIAAKAIQEENASHDPRGHITMSATEAAGYLHTELNPAAGTMQNPNDDILQVGERVVGQIPLAPNKGQ